MVFSSISFLYLFLPVTLLLYYISPRKIKNTILLFASLIFYYIGEQALVLVMLVSVAVNYIAALLINRFTMKKGIAKAILAFSLVFDFCLLGYYKYMNFFIGSYNLIFNTSIPLLNIALPIGISFYVFQVASYTVDVYRGTVPVQKNPIELATYVTMFPQLIAGPIVRYKSVLTELSERKCSIEQFAYGVRRFTMGLAKKVILANNFAVLVNASSVSVEKSVLFYWLSALGFTLQIYFDFSGYSDMAIGLGKMFGFNFPENFNYPYISSSICEFWRRWHITLGTWFRDYVYIPIGGNRKGLSHQIFNIFVVWLLTGLWHRSEWNFAIWGLMYALLIIIEKLFLGKLLTKLPRFVGIGYTLFFTVIGFVIFNGGNAKDILSSLSGLFGFNNIELYGMESLYYLRSYALTFVIAIVAATPLCKRLVEKCKHPVLLTIAEPVVCVLLLIVSTAYLIDGSFNPFLYFRF